MKYAPASTIRGTLTKNDLLKHEGSWVLIRSGVIEKSGENMNSVVSGVNINVPDYLVIYISKDPIW